MEDRVCSVSNAVRKHVTTIQQALSEALHTPLHGEYFLDHSGWDDKLDVTSKDLIKSFQDVYCYRYDLLNKFYERILVDTDDIESPGVTAEEEYLPRLLYSQPVETELGGGIGGGFQLYCDGELVLTAGGGAGGGGYINLPTGTVTFGNGAGAGAQILNGTPSSTNSFVSIGGGGGCNTCDHGTAMDAVVVTCGTATDSDAVPLTQFQSSLRHLRHQCRIIAVYGGGGGGGGIVRAGTAETGAGYGYSFYLNGRIQSKGTDGLVQVDSPPAPVGVPATATDGSRNMHAVFYKLLNASVASCGGYAHWKCVCKETQRHVQDCSSAALPISASADCTVIRAANESIHAMLSGSCRSTDSPGSDVIERCPMDGTLVYSRTYLVIPGRAGNQLGKVVVDYVYDTDSGLVSSPSAWIGSGVNSTVPLMGAGRLNGEAGGHSALLRAAKLATGHEHQHTHSEYLVVILLLVAIFAGLLCVCRSFLQAMLVPAHVDRSEYIELS